MSTLSDNSARPWWPKGSDKNSKPKFNLASAIGLKPKKHHPPPLTINDPPRIIPPARLIARSEPSSQRRPYTAPSPAGRPPSSSSRSIEPNTPKTPEDFANPRRGSLLTLSDSDPFAARAVSIHSPSDPNRLSAFSNSSALAYEPKSNAGLNRVSYASSSSQSFRLGSDLSPMSVMSPASEAGSPYIKPKRSSHNLRGNEASADTTWLSSFGIDHNRLSQPDPPPKPRPVMRARGMTDAGIERTNFLRNDPVITRAASSSSSQNLARRQLSLSRPTAPPNSEIPLPPRSPADKLALGHNSAGSTSSTSLTFSTEFTSSPRANQRTIDLSDTPPRPTHRTLKKSISHQSIKRAQPPASSPPSAPLPQVIKAPRKQRSFHRLPVQAVPLQLPLSDQRAEPSTRKRLFSTSSSRRPSTANTLAEDARSITGSTAAPEPLAATSYWVDTDQPPRSPVSVYEYTPQQIMSPAEMLQVEASVDAGYHRSRVSSINSVSTMQSDFGAESSHHGLSPAPSFGGARARSNSDHPSVRKSSVSEQDLLYYSISPQPSSPPVMAGLPPPPRRAKQRAPPPLIRSHSDVVTPLSPPPRKNLRPKASVEERMQKRKSIMRKPSFLEIDDPVDREPQMLRQGSFLDLTRGSFDSTRSEDSF